MLGDTLVAINGQATRHMDDLLAFKRRCGRANRSGESGARRRGADGERHAR